MYEITAVNFGGQPPRLEAIIHYYFEARGGGSSTWRSKADAVNYVRNNPGAVFTSGRSGGRTIVEVVEANPPYLRTQANGTSSDNLLSLPSY